MNIKQEMIEAVIPEAVLQALTLEAIDAVPKCLLLTNNIVCIHSFPFKIGRESRVQKVNGRIERVERPAQEENEPNNDLYLLDRGPLLNVSREHIKLEKHNGVYMLLDRGSACGTKVVDCVTGAEERGSSFVLKDGDTIVLGADETNFKFKFISLEGVKVRVSS